MSIRNTVKKLARIFKYTSDESRHGEIDCWYVLSEKNPRGDCEDFAITCLVWYLGWWGFFKDVIVFNRGQIWFVSSPGDRNRDTSKEGDHAIGFYDGLWFDNFSLDALEETAYFRKYQHKRISQYSGLQIFKKILAGKIGKVPATLVTYFLLALPFIPLVAIFVHIIQ